MMPLLRSFLALGLVAMFLVGCQTLSGKTARESVDDTKITAAVKTKLASEKVATLTTIDVDTNRGTVYLTGNVDSAAMKERATNLARQVAGVREVVNNLKVTQQ